MKTTLERCLLVLNLLSAVPKEVGAFRFFVVFVHIFHSFVFIYKHTAPYVRQALKLNHIHLFPLVIDFVLLCNVLHFVFVIHSCSIQRGFCTEVFSRYTYSTCWLCYALPLFVSLNTFTFLRAARSLIKVRLLLTFSTRSRIIVFAFRRKDFVSLCFGTEVQIIVCYSAAAASTTTTCCRRYTCFPLLLCLICSSLASGLLLCDRSANGKRTIV